MKKQTRSILQELNTMALNKNADHLIESYVKSFKLPAVILRPFNTYGPRQSNRAIIPTIITQILNKNSLKIGSLTPKRDFNYVENVAETFEKILVSSKLKGEEVNISSGKSIFSFNTTNSFPVSHHFISGTPITASSAISSS